MDHPEDIPSSADEARIRHCLQGFPEETVGAAVCYSGRRDRASFALALRRLVAFHLPSKTKRPLDEAPGETRLREDLGLDSLSVAEAAFVADDLFQVNLPIQEMHVLETLGELEEFLWVRVHGASGPFAPANKDAS